MSVHLYHGADPYGPEIDRLLLDGVQPLVDALLTRAWIDRYFFVRYADPASHLRLRVRLTSDAAGAEVAATIRGWPFQVPGFETNSRELIREVPYLPEFDRYGGEAGMAIAEDVFALSSQTALRLLHATRHRGRPALLGQAILVSLLLAHSLVEDWELVRQFLGGDGFLTHDPSSPARVEPDDERPSAALDAAVEALTTAVAAGLTLGIPLLDEWTAGCREINLKLRAAGLAALGRSYGRYGPLLRSYLHMHHNRLGFSQAQERALAGTAAAALARRQNRRGHESGVTG